MKAAVIIFHRHAYRYNPTWIQKCLNSIRHQTYKQFDVFELDYGGEHTQLYAGSNFSYTNSIKDHAEAHNWLLDKVFELGYDCAFNVNIDDIYSLDRFEKQIEAIKEGYDVVSSNFFHINEKGRLINSLAMDTKDILHEAKRGHNIIAHPVCCYSKNFWTNCSKLRSSEIPKDDFELWKRSIHKFKFKILPNFLLYYRIHSSKVSAAGQWK